MTSETSLSTVPPPKGEIPLPFTCITRRSVNWFVNLKTKVEQRRFYRLLTGLVALAPLAVPVYIQLQIEPLAIAIYVGLALLWLTAIFVDVVFVLPAAILLVMFWGIVSFFALYDLFFSSRHLFRRPNRITLVILLVDLVFGMIAGVALYLK